MALGPVTGQAFHFRTIPNKGARCAHSRAEGRPRFAALIRT
jgi:hypothetical protein